MATKLTTDQIYAYLERLVAEDKLSGDATNMRTVQWAATMIMRAAQANGDDGTAQRFMFLASQAANKHDQLRSK